MPDPSTPPPTSTRGTHDALADERNASVFVYIDGRFYPREQAKVSVFDSGFLVGDGVWEGIRLHHGRFAFLERHLDRLYAGAAAIGLDIGKTRAELAEALAETCRVNGMEDGVHLRLMVTRGVKKTPAQDPRLVIGGPTIVIVAEYKAADPDVTRAGIRLFTSSTRRPPPDTLDPKLNCHSKLHEVVALVQALRAGADEALMLDVHGNVATCNATNFFIVRRGEVWTSTGEHCLNGITRALVIELARAEGIAAFERPFSLTDVYSADEAFVTGTFGGLTPVTHVDGRRIGAAAGHPERAGAGPVTTRLSARYRELVDAQASQA